MKIHSFPYLVIFLFCLIGAVCGYLLSYQDHPYHRIMITIEATKLAETQLFYDTGGGFNELGSIRKVIYHPNTPVTLYFGFSVRNLYALRFDPSRSPVTMKILSIVIQYQGEQPFTVPLDSLVPAKDILSNEYDGRVLIFATTETAEDPIFLLNKIGLAPHVSLLRTVYYMLAGAFVSLALVLFILWVYRSIQISIARCSFSARRIP
jgi:hypothetical protein